MAGLAVSPALSEVFMAAPHSRSRAKSTPRRRDAVATRAAILDSARRHFGLAGYDHAGVREIAADAGVTAALVNRYFGSKAALFAEVLSGGLQMDAVLPAERAAFGRVIAELLARRRPGRGIDPMALYLRSAASPDGAKVLRARVDDQLVAPLARWLGGGDDAVVRAALVVSCMMGLSIVRRVLRSSALPVDDATDARLAALLGPVLQECIGE